MTAPAAPVWGTLDPFVEAGPVLGRKVANRGFLQALLQADPFAAYHFFLVDSHSTQALSAFIQNEFPSLEKKVHLFPRTALPTLLASTDYHCFHLSDCLTSQGFLAAFRNRLAKNIFPITGVTHSLSYARHGRAFLQHVWSGTTPRDCIVATSQAGASVVRNELGALQGYASAPVPVPQVRVIPLGLHCQDFTATEHAHQNLTPAEKTVFLIPGRISPYSKMDILPLLRAFQRLGRDGVPLAHVSLILAGDAQESTSLPDTLFHLAANIGLDLRVVHSPDDPTRNALLHQADVVVSLSDNPQETFGLTVLEAAAAGKPIIAADYDGYRDLVRQAETGFLIPTLDSGHVADISLLAPLLYDTTYHLWLAQDVVVDVPELASRLHEVLDPNLRKRMGQAASSHALNFDWSTIIARYLDLWAELNACPAPKPKQGHPHPLTLDYGQIFAAYPSARLHDEALLVITALGQAVYRKKDFPVIYAGVEDRIDLKVMRALLVWTRQALSWKELRAKAGNECLPTLMWMLKNDLLAVSRASKNKPV